MGCIPASYAGCGAIPILLHSSPFTRIKLNTAHYRLSVPPCRSSRGKASIFLQPASLARKYSALLSMLHGFAGHESLLISRERLTALFQVSAATQRRWERLTGVLVTFNVVEVSASDAEAAAQHLPQDARLDQFDRLGRSYSWNYQGNLYYRTVNRYEAPSNPQLQRAATGNVRKVSRAVRHILPVDDHGDGTGHAERRRIFYDRRTTPGNYQEAKGACMRATLRHLTTDRGPVIPVAIQPMATGGTPGCSHVIQSLENYVSFLEGYYMVKRFFPKYVLFLICDGEVTAKPLP